MVIGGPSDPSHESINSRIRIARIPRIDDVLGSSAPTLFVVFVAIRIREFLHFHFNIHPRWKTQAGERLDSLWRRIHDVEEPLVHPHLILITRILIDER